MPGCRKDLKESDWTPYFERVSLPAGTHLFTHEDHASRMFVLAAGNVVSSCDNADARVPSATSFGNGNGNIPHGSSSSRHGDKRNSGNGKLGDGLSKMHVVNSFVNLKGVSAASTQGLYPEPLAVASAGHLVAGGVEQEQLSAMRLPRWRLTKAPHLIGAFIFMADSHADYGYDCRGGMRGAVLYAIDKQRLQALETERPDLAGIFFKAMLTSLCEVWNNSHGSAFTLQED